MAEDQGVVVLKSENIDNPFTSEGILSQKADYVIAHSTITRTTIEIADPDAIKIEEKIQQNSQNAVDQFSKVTLASPKNEGRIESIEVEVGHTSMAEPMRAQEVQLKKKRRWCSCCS